MPDKNEIEAIKEKLLDSCCNFQKECCQQIEQNTMEQHPHIAILCCSDSRVPPELIFKKEIGEIFDVRVAGNVAIDTSVIFSLEYAVEHLDVDVLMILGHTGCGAVSSAEDLIGDENPILKEIRSSFSLNDDHYISNIVRQMEMLPRRSDVICQALEKESLTLLGALYHIEDGRVEFIDRDLD